jgi:hypothetical protein
VVMLTWIIVWVALRNFGDSSWSRMTLACASLIAHALSKPVRFSFLQLMVKYQRVLKTFMLALVMASLMHDCAPLIAQSAMHIDETFNISGNNRNPDRLLTICFGSSEYLCVDLEVKNKLKKLFMYINGASNFS